MRAWCRCVGRRLPVLVALLLATATGALRAAPLGSLDELLRDASVWTGGADDFMLRAAPLGFGYVSQRDTARSARTNLTFLAFPVLESLAYFGQGKVKRVEISLYNRGDAAELPQAAFERLVERAGDALTAWGGAGCLGETTSDRANQFVKRRQWARPPAAAELEWGYSDPRRHDGVTYPFRAEFVRVRLVYSSVGGVMGMRALGQATKPQPVTASVLKQRLRRGSNGDVWVGEVPMVDQGQKGYCAAATAERLLRYYGWDVDQHEIAQLAETSATGGTRNDAMMDAVQRIGERYAFTTRSLLKMEYRELAAMIDGYNREVRGTGQPEIRYGRTIDVNAVFLAMDAARLRTSRGRNGADVSGFLRNVSTSVDAGVPLTWSVIVGKFPENPPLPVQGAFGHVRLIVGYNARTREILYSDSWGPGHDLKRMPLDDAWAMSLGLCVTKPSSVR